MSELTTRLRIQADFAQALEQLRKVRAEAAAAGVSLKGLAQPVDVAASAGKAAKDLAAGTAAAAAGIKATRAAAEDTAQASAQAARAVKGTTDAAAAGLKQTQQQLRQLGPQITDIVTGLATGQSPLMVLIQQGGQLRDVFGGTGNAVSALLGLLTPARLLIGGIAAAVGTLAFQAYKGSQDTAELRKQIALTGNAAGVTSDTIDRLTTRIARQQNTSAGQVRETLTALVGSNQFVGATLESAGRAATALAKVTGSTAEESVRQFDSMGGGVAAWAAKANQAYNFITAEQFKYIRSLEAQGRQQEAMRVTLDELAATMEQRHAPALGTIERLWGNVKKVTGEALESLRSYGREESAEERIDSLRAKLERLRTLGRNGLLSAPGEALTAFRGVLGLPGGASFEQQAQDAERQIAETARLASMDALRATERAAALKAEQQKIVDSGKAFQDSLAQVEAAGAAKRLAQQQAQLERQRAMVERQYATGLVSSEQYALQLNEIDQKRLVAQRAALQAQIAIERAKVEAQPGDDNAKRAAVLQLEAQILQVNGQLAVSEQKRLQIAEDDALADAQEKARAWAEVWTRASTQVRQLAQQAEQARAQLIADPVQRAAAEAEAKTADIRRQLAELEGSLTLRIDMAPSPEAAEELQRQLDQLRAGRDEVVGEQERVARLTSLQAQVAEAMGRLQTAEAQLDAQVAAGAIDAEEAESRKLDLRRQALPVLERMLELLRQIAKTPAERNAVDDLANRLKAATDLRTDMEKTARSSGAQALRGLFNDLASGAKTWKEASVDAVRSFGLAMLDLINKRLAEKLVDQMMKAIDGAGIGGGPGGGIGDILGALVRVFIPQFHSGGFAGSPAQWRAISPLAAAAAITSGPRFHSGLRSNELLAVLEDDETVLTARQTRQLASRVGALNFSSSITVAGAGGSTRETQSAAEDLDRRIRVTVQSWAAEQQRPGGILAGRR